MTDIRQITATLNQVILGKDEQIRLSLCCLLARGHLLIEDLPGMGKTTLSHALAAVFGLKYARVQFTSDLMPADVLGVNIYEKDPDSGQGRFRFHPGPVFSEVVLADEINRAPAKSQSALLEAMEERQVTIEGESHSLPNPFFVIATQNPVSQAGTYNLPESQLDRFLMRISLGYPDEASERALLEGTSRRGVIDQLQPLMTAETLLMLQQQVHQVKPSAAVLDYLQRIIAHTRHRLGYAYGLSPRGGLALLTAAKSWALLSERQYLIPEDIQAVLAAVVDHRLPDSAGASARLLNEVQVLA